MADSFSINTSAAASADVRGQAIDASKGAGIVGSASAGRMDLSTRQISGGPNPLGFLGKIAAQVVEPIIKQQEAQKFAEGMAKAVAGETAQDINHERPAWARIFGDSAAVSGARAYEGAADSSRLEGALYSAMPELVKRDGTEVAREATRIMSQMATGDPVRDSTLQQHLPQILPNILRMHATGRAKYLQDEAAASDTRMKVEGIQTYNASQAALSKTAPLDSTDASVQRQQAQALVDRMTIVQPGQTPEQAYRRSMEALLGSTANGDFGAFYAMEDAGALERFEKVLPGSSAQLRRAVTAAEKRVVDDAAFTVSPGVTQFLINLSNGVMDAPAAERERRKLNKEINEATGTRYAEYLSPEMVVRASLANTRAELAQERAAAAADRRLAADQRRAASAERSEAKARAKDEKEALKGQVLTGLASVFDKVGADAAVPGQVPINAQTVQQSIAVARQVGVTSEKVNEAFGGAMLSHMDKGNIAGVAALLSNTPGESIPTNVRNVIRNGLADGGTQNLNAVRIWALAQEYRAVRARLFTREDGQDVDRSAKLVQQTLGAEDWARFLRGENLDPAVSGRLQSVLESERATYASTVPATSVSKIAQGLDEQRRATNAVDDAIDAAYPSVGDDMQLRLKQELIGRVYQDYGGDESVPMDERVKAAISDMQQRVLSVGPSLVARQLDPRNPMSPAQVGYGNSPKTRSDARTEASFLAAVSKRTGGMTVTPDMVMQLNYGNVDGTNIYRVLIKNPKAGGRAIQVDVPMNDAEYNKGDYGTGAGRGKRPQ